MSPVRAALVRTNTNVRAVGPLLIGAHLYVFTTNQLL